MASSGEVQPLSRQPHEYCGSALRWISRGTLAIGDHALFSGASLLLNLLLARHLSTADYGSFALMYSMLLVVSGFHNALLLEPMTVIGTAKYPNQLHEYLRSQFKLHILFCICIGPLGAVAGAVMRHMLPDRYFGDSLISAAIVIPWVLLFWLVRRTCYVIGYPKLAVRGSAINIVAILLLVWFLLRNHLAGAISASIVLALGSVLAVALVLLHQPFRFLLRPDSRCPIEFKQVLSENWIYGRWVLVSAVVLPVCTQLQAFYAAGALGISALGILRAMQVLPMGLIQVNTALVVLVLPLMAADFGQNAFGALVRKALVVSLLITLLSVVCTLFFFRYGLQIEGLIYGGKFREYAWMMAVLALMPVFNAVANGFSMIFRAVHQPRLDVLTYSIAAPFAAIATVILTTKLGLKGTVWSMAVGTCSIAVAAAIVYLWRFAGSSKRADLSGTFPAMQAPTDILE